MRGNRSFQFSHLDSGEPVVSLAILSVSTECQHFQVTSEKLSQALGQLVCLMPKLDSELAYMEHLTGRLRDWRTC